MQKFLLITYYWPPFGGGGVQRWLKMSKYFREFNWEPVVYTAESGEQAAFDPDLELELPEGIETIRTPIWEPYDWYKRLTRRNIEDKIYSGFINEEKKTSFSQNLAVFIRGNFFIPDARMFWIKPSIRYLVEYLSNNKVDVIISTGPPHSMHMIALGIKKHFDIPWVADFRDPWTQQDFYEQLNLTRWADRVHKRKEQEVLTKADRIVTVSWNWAEEFKKLSKGHSIDIIPNGFDISDFTTAIKKRDPKFTICHIGSMNKDRNPRILWQALSILMKTNLAFAENLKIKLIGQIDYSIFEAIQQHGLKDKLEHHGFMPHAEVIKYMQKAQLLLLPINNTPNALGILPGKLYEYLGAKRPILAIGPLNSDAANILSATKAGTINDYEDLDGLKNNIAQFFDQFQTGNLEIDSANFKQFSRRSLAGNYAALLDELSPLSRSPGE